jgi:hypothetical protein
MHQEPKFFLLLLGRVRVLDFCCSYCVFIKFTLSSQHFPNSSSFYPIFFALSFTLENLYVQPKGEGYNMCILEVSNARALTLPTGSRFQKERTTQRS